MGTTKSHLPNRLLPSIPWFGARRMARELVIELQDVRAQRDETRKLLETMATELQKLRLQVDVAPVPAAPARQPHRGVAGAQRGPRGDRRSSGAVSRGAANTGRMSVGLCMGISPRGSTTY
jgi:hypothetical protein